jgi:flagellar biosynthesis GTPase FlhF
MEQSSSMRIKSYFANSVEQAIQEARQELGTDAMLIMSRRSSPETRSLGAYEVVFGLNAPSSQTRAVAPPADLSGELQHLRNQLQEIKSTLQGGRPSEFPSSESEEIFEELVTADLAPNIAREISAAASRLREQISRDQPAAALPLRAYATELLSKKLRFAPPFQKPLSQKTGA